MAQVYNPYAPQQGQGRGLTGMLGGGGMGGGGRFPGFPGNSYGNAAQGIVQQGGQAGFFNPMGSPQLLAAVRQMALRNSMNQQHRGALLSRLLGLDPQQSRAAQLGFEQQGGSDISNALLGAGTQQLTGAQDFIRSLFGQGLQGEQQLAQAKVAAKAAKDAAHQQMLAGIGGLVGKGLSALPFSSGRGGSSAGSFPSQTPNYQDIWQSIGGG